MRFAAAALLLGLAVVPASAEPKAVPVDCAKASSTPEIAFCAQEDFERADKLLNEAYKGMLAKVGSASADVPGLAVQQKAWREALVESQRRWIAFRDADCAAVGAGWMGGTGMGAAVSNCLADATRARTKVLQSRTREGG
ncbi:MULTISPECIES: lysozyme inhibitor LprI family protein [Methylobacterium]|uniref:Lysozyme inhibitor LprI-like N-terminal domain-containing protein n=1 Tax=Methylobacterium jeotgali TaxID=381630 RepID=A0ABQ4SVB1_9HYPH|nr:MULTISPECIES: lysozyme inhibitor LprI family protein [Methylobacterium]PIU05838.1 MAG: hypothetical protein COT56_12965 [Methylobacterium sp. CG09_land_8_20_14_0_10_71_15]PIU13247.1 MAG: hypothetical protein COT28_12135 [Methylobacterium sp. CG08_land_8_20_14_0_20_71_15]GBU19100.1 hypothetical protein AwMethylo_33150 [Methylobacterium sp.]GJE06439.1 hypothetical protein AOPFMNJM_1758 [Methylobacterium jeotgali]